MTSDYRICSFELSLRADDVRRFQVLCVLVALASRHLTAAAMTRHAALASGFARFLAGPLVGRALLMGGLAALAGNLALLRAVHRSESAIFFSHSVLPTITIRFARVLCEPPFQTVGLQPRCHGSSGILVTLSNKGTYLPSFPQHAGSVPAATCDREDA